MYSQYFAPEEFQGWAEKMSPRLVAFLDSLRHRLGVPVRISMAPGAVGRDGQGTGQHYFEKWGEIRAVDFFVDNVYSKASAARVIEIATSVGFTGVGVYPDWKNNEGEPQVGFHVDVREDAAMGVPATWGRLGREYVSSYFALSQMGELKNDK